MGSDTPVYDVVLAGKGGQGVLFLSRIIGEAALIQGMGVRTTETHGMAMRGGSVQCFVRLGECMGPLFGEGSASLLIALHAGELSMGLKYLSPEGKVLVNSEKSEIKVGPVQRPYVHALDADAIARTANNPRSANLALLGGAVSLVEGFPIEIKSIEEAIRMRGPEGIRENNLEIFHLGMGGLKKE